MKGLATSVPRVTGNKYALIFPQSLAQKVSEDANNSSAQSELAKSTTALRIERNNNGAVVKIAAPEDQKIMFLDNDLNPQRSGTKTFDEEGQEEIVQDAMKTSLAVFKQILAKINKLLSLDHKN